MEYSFCTYFDQHYFSRGLALYQSLRQHCSSFTLWILCLDSRCYEDLTAMHLSRYTLGVATAIRDIRIRQEEVFDIRVQTAQLREQFIGFRIALLIKDFGT